jgi:hypothetical protein
MKTQYGKGSKGNRNVEEENHGGAGVNCDRRPECHAGPFQEHIRFDF